MSSNLYLSATIIVLLVFEITKKQDCEKYKTGRFYIHNKMSKQRINIERNGSLQVETNAESGDITVMNVKWTSSCEYELLFNYMTPKDVSKSKDIQKVVETSVNIPLRIKILSGTEDYYVFEAGKEGFQNLRDTVWLVK